MVGQAAEGLGTDDILKARLGQLQHLSGEEPALAHFVPVADNAVHQLLHMPVGGRGLEAGLGLDGLDEHVLHLFQVVVENLYHLEFGLAAAVNADVIHAVVHLKEDEVDKPRHVDLAVLLRQEILQMVVGKGGVLHIDFPHNAHPDLGHLLHRDGGEVGGEFVEILLLLLNGAAVPLVDFPER